jgi:hypothetical protein
MLRNIKMNSPRLLNVTGALVIAFALGAMAVVGYQLASQTSSFGGIARSDDAVCLKEIRLTRLLTTPGLVADLDTVTTPQMCDAPQNLRISPKVLHMTGDTYAVQCDAPGHAASSNAVTVFYWDKGAKYGEQIAIRKHQSSDELILTPQCERYGIRPAKSK